MLNRPSIHIPRQQPAWPLELNRRNTITQGLIAVWPFLLAGGDTLYDLGGYGLHGTLLGMNPAPVWVATDQGTALEFDRVDGRFVDLSAVAASVSPTQGTFGALVRFDFSVGDGFVYGILEISGATNDDFIGLRRHVTEDVIFRYRSGASNSDAVLGTVPGSTWFHVVGTYDASGLKIYRDGFLVDTSTRGPDISPALVQGAMAARGQGTVYGTRVLSGNIAFSYMFDRPLSDAEVLQMYEDPWQVFVQEQPHLFSFASEKARATVTGRGYSSAVPTVAHHAASTVVGKGFAASVPTVTHRASAAATGFGFVSATGSPVHAAKASASGVGAASGLATVDHHAQASATGSASVAALADVTHSGSATATGRGLVLALATPIHYATATADAYGTAIATGSVEEEAAAPWRTIRLPARRTISRVPVRRTTARLCA